MQELDTQMFPDGRCYSATEIVEPERMTTSDAARARGVSTSTIRRWIARGYLDATRTPAGYLVDASGLAAAQAMANAKRKPAIPRSESVRRDDGQHDDRVVSEQPSVVREPNSASQRAHEASQVPDVAFEEPGMPDSPQQQASAPIASGNSRAPSRPRYQSDRRRMLEGLQRGIILEQAKYQRAQRRKDAIAMERSAWRLAELCERLDDAKASAAVDRGVETASLSALSPLRAMRSQVMAASHLSAAMYARATPSRRMFSVATLLILNGVLMMLMSFIA